MSKFIDFSYGQEDGFVSFDTSSLTGLTISDATLRIYFSTAAGAFENDDSRSVEVGYSAAWNGRPTVTGDYELDASGIATPVGIGSVTANAYLDFTLTDLTGINQSGNTYVTVTISGGVVAGVNYVGYEKASDAHPPQLVVTTVAPTQSATIAWITA